jgi:hypothetical protein
MPTLQLFLIFTTQVLHFIGHAEVDKRCGMVLVRQLRKEDGDPGLAATEQENFFHVISPPTRYASPVENCPAGGFTKDPEITDGTRVGTVVGTFIGVGVEVGTIHEVPE